MSRDDRDIGGIPPSGEAPVAHILAQGKDWRISAYTCHAGPQDRPFEERHEEFTIAAVLDGSFKYRADTGTALLHPGAFVLGNHGTCFECGHDHSAGDRCIAFHFAPDYFSEIAASVAGSARYRFPIAMVPVIDRLLPQLVRIETRAAAGDPLGIEETVPELMETVIDVISGVGTSPVRVSAHDEKRISAVLRYIERDATETVNLERLASVAAMSKYHFLRTFRRVVGMTPYRFVLGARMRRATVRLVTSDEAVSAIAFASGFGDLSTFNNRFRDLFGMSPRVFRKRERKG
jgi:AraC family transcriptional regulator